jgi:cytochrome c peroxidase
MGYHNKFLWNGAISGSLEDAMLFEVEDFFNTDISKLQNDPEYPALFYKAFGSKVITSEKCAYALAQFLRTMVSGNSRFDRVMRHEEMMTLEESLGFNIFNTEKGDCFHCHSLSLLTDGDLHNIGLDSLFAGVDAGHFNVSGNPADLGKFRTPSLRNCGIRSSFMHDGRYTTLDQVIEHYNSQVKQSPSLDPIMTKPGKEFGLGFTAYDKQCLKAFLMTLTDSTFLNEPAFSSPF